MKSPSDTHSFIHLDGHLPGALFTYRYGTASVTPVTFAASPLVWKRNRISTISTSSIPVVIDGMKIQ